MTTTPTVRVHCHSCGRGLVDGDTAYASDVRVIEPGGVRVVTRYQCEACEERATA